MQLDKKAAGNLGRIVYTQLSLAGYAEIEE